MTTREFFGFQWHLTDRCNMRCSHCYQQSFTSRSELPLDALCAMADRIFSALPDHSITANLTGGEPLLFPELIELIAHLQNHDNLAEVSLITNGTITSPPLLTELRRFDKLRYFKVSLESGVARINDRIRGRGNLEAVTAAIGTLLRRTGRPVIVMVTLGAYNLDTIAETVRYARVRGASGVIFERFVPLGRGQSRLGGDVLSASAWSRALSAIATAAELDCEIDDLLPYRAFWLSFEDGGGLEGALCNLGPDAMALMPDGTVYPCRRLPLGQGNLRHESFESIRSKLAAFSIPALRHRLRGGPCGRCDVEQCAGCRASTLAVTGSLDDADPQCPRLAL